MKKIFIIFLMIQNICSFAQTEWAPIGATWHYNRPYVTNEQCVYFKSLKDTIIQNNKCRVIEVKINPQSSSPLMLDKIYLYQQNDSILYFDTEKFCLLYNFAAKIGDTIIVQNSKFKPSTNFLYSDSIKCFKYKIIDIDSVAISSIWLKRQKIEALNSDDWGFSNLTTDVFYLVEKIGSLNYFFGQAAITNPEMTPSLCRCYSDNSISYTSSDWNYTCDFTTEIKKEFSDLEYRIFPNPCSDFLNVHSPNPIKNINIVSSNSRIVINRNVNDKNCVLNINSLNKGVYFLQISTDKNISYFKFIKK